MSNVPRYVRYRKAVYRLAANEMTEFAKKRALEYVAQGQLKEAIDSMFSDLSKDPTRPAMQQQMIGAMAMSLRNKPDLSERDVVEFIEGFN